jgi:hypothetical protein
MHEDIMFVNHNEDDYRELCGKLERNGFDLTKSIRWISWQIETAVDSKYMTKEEGFNLLFYIINYEK